MCQGGVLTEGPDIVCPMRPVRPDFYRHIPYVLTQRRILRTSRLLQILPVVTSSSGSFSLPSLLLCVVTYPAPHPPSSTLNQNEFAAFSEVCLLASGAAALVLSHLRSHVSRITPHWSGELMMWVQSRTYIIYI